MPARKVMRFRVVVEVPNELLYVGNLGATSETALKSAAEALIQGALDPEFGMRVRVLGPYTGLPKKKGG